MDKTSESVINTKDLRKTYPARGRGKASVEAVQGISFEVGRGEIFGLLGPNGAGKTTTMRMLCTLLEPTSGSAKIAQEELSDDQAKIRKEIGYVSQVGGMQREVTGRENLMLQARLYGMSKEESKKRINELLELLQISSFADRKTVTYSGGQRRIFDLAAGIIHRPQILFLDEPSTGLDPQNRAHVWEQVKKLNQAGTTIFVTTHYLDEADALCNRVAIVDGGKIVAIGTPDELKRQISGDSINLGFTDEVTAKQALQALEGSSFIKEKNIKDFTLNLYVENGEENLPLVISTLHQKGILSKSIQLSRPSLDDVFLKLTGRSLRESETA
jgi:ABC-2 type transport system ATP-binding protein